MAKAKKLFTIGYEQTPSKAVLDEHLPAVPAFPRTSSQPASTRGAFRICTCVDWARRRAAVKRRAAANSSCYIASTRRI